MIKDNKSKIINEPFSVHEGYIMALIQWVEIDKI